MRVIQREREKGECSDNENKVKETPTIGKYAGIESAGYFEDEREIRGEGLWKRGRVCKGGGVSIDRYRTPIQVLK